MDQKFIFWLKQMMILRSRIPVFFLVYILGLVLKFNFTEETKQIYGN